MRFLLAVAALLVALVPRAALAHGDESHAAAQSTPKVFAHPSCPGGSGDCCCRGVVATGMQQPAVSNADWQRLLLPHRCVPAPAAAVCRGARPHSLARSRAPPLFL